MKRIVLILLLIGLLITLCACGSSERSANTSSQTDQTSDNSQTVENEPEEEIKPVQMIEIGEKISTPDYEITFDGVSIGHLVHDGFYISGDIVAPDGYDGSRAVYDYSAGVFVKIKNLKKEAIRIYNYGIKGSYCIAKIDYNDGYIYEAKELLINGYRESGRVELNPLDEAKLFFSIEISEDAYQNRDNPLTVIITMGDGMQYQYQVSDNNYR